MDFHTRFIELAGHVNNEMPYHVLTLIARALNAQHKSLNGSRVVLLGVAYKPDIDDYRESPIFKIMELLLAERCDRCWRSIRISTSSSTTTARRTGQHR